MRSRTEGCALIGTTNGAGRLGLEEMRLWTIGDARRTDAIENISSHETGWFALEEVDYPAAEMMIGVPGGLMTDLE